VSDFGLMLAMDLRSDLYHEDLQPFYDGVFLSFVDDYASSVEQMRIPVSPGNF